MDHVKSKDGTVIAFDRVGTGPAVILVGGAIDDGAENAPLGPALGDRFTVYNYARRGRGESGDSPPYAVEREIEDLDAIITEAGEGAHVFGASSGGGLALEAAAAGLVIDRLAVYEVPYAMADEGPHWDRRDVPADPSSLTDCLGRATLGARPMDLATPRRHRPGGSQTHDNPRRRRHE